MSNFAPKLAKYNNNLRYYVVVPAFRVIGEDGKYIEVAKDEIAGYAIENKETGVIEHTNVCLPAALFQASHFDDMLASLLDETPKLSIVSEPAEDVLPN